MSAPPRTSDASILVLLAFYASQIGCEIPEHLSWTSLSAWKWWSSGGNRRFSKMLLDGVNSPHAYRLWGAKKWEGAREAIERANGGV
ncbi:hypothetical protein BDY24DRAFT_390704 [Mrakia frigida]|uniref:uncharacterized protein n=1 Tax=Mrakia frigida TaxID=29902 RepID=UPI003FCC0D3B